jgi:hypothetical protein
VNAFVSIDSFEIDVNHFLAEDIPLYIANEALLGLGALHFDINNSLIVPDDGPEVIMTDGDILVSFLVAVNDGWNVILTADPTCFGGTSPSPWLGR